MAGEPRRRLNPFAFPPETNQRFVLLLASVLMLAVDLGGFVLVNLYGSTNVSVPDRPDLVGQAFFEQAIADRLTVIEGVLRLICGHGLIVLAVVVGALIIYRTHARRIQRRQHLTPLAPQTDQAFSAAIGELADRAGVSIPAVEFAQGDLGTDGQAFGFRPRYRLRVGGRLPLLMRRAPQLFRATVLHEFAHIANGDIARTYFTQSIAVAFVIVLVVPLAGTAAVSLAGAFVRRVSSMLNGQPDWVTFFTQAIPTAGLLFAQAGILLVVIAMLRASILRVREMYADWRAALWGVEPGLLEILNRAARSGAKQISWFGRARAVLRLHPTPQERIDALQHPDRLFRLKNDLPLFAGILTGVTFSGMLPIMAQSALLAEAVSTIITASVGLAGARQESPLLLLAAILLFVVLSVAMVLLIFAPVAIVAYTVAESIGLQLQREAAAALADASRRSGGGALLKLIPPALLMTLGLEVGFLSVPLSLFAPLVNITNYDTPILKLLLIPLETVGWVAGVTLIIWLWLLYVRIFARRMLARHTGSTLPQSVRRVLTLASTLLLGVLLLPVLAWQAMIYRELGVAIPVGAVAALVGGAAVIYAAIFAGSWLVSTLLGRRPRCPVCQTPAPEANVIGRTCHRCGSDLAPWLFVEPDG